MNNYFECKVKYEKLNPETGGIRKVSESYLIDAVTFGETEARLYKELESIIDGEFLIKAIGRSNIAEVRYLGEESDSFYRCKVTFVDVDEETGKEKKVKIYILLSAENAKQAYDLLTEYLAETMAIPFEIPDVTESQIVKVFEYEEV